MKKRVLMSSIAASVLASMFAFSGCGSSSTVAEVPISNPDATTPDTTTPDTTTPDTTTPVLETRSCSQLTYVGSVQGVQVQGIDASGEVFATVTTDANGQYCFTEKPSEVKIVSGKGIDGRLDKDVSCSSDAMNFAEVTPCFTIDGFDADSSPLHSLSRAKQFRSFMGDVFEEMYVEFDAYDTTILAALKMSSIIDIQDKLSSVKTVDAYAQNADNNLTAAQKAIIADIVEIATSPVAEDTVSLAMYSFLAASADVKENADGNKTLETLINGDGGVISWINDNKLLVERYINENTPDSDKNRAVVTVEKAGVNLKIFASYLVSKIKDGTLGANVNLAALEAAIPPAALGEHYLETTYIACGPLAERITVDADYNNTRIYFGDISNINCSTGCETVYANYVDGNSSKAVTELVMQTKGIQFNEAGEKLTTAEQYAHIKEFAGDLFNLNIDFDMNKTHGVTTTNPLLATIILDVPNACSSDDISKDEYVAMTFKIVPTGFDNADGNGSFVIPANTDIVFSSRIMAKDDQNVTIYPKLIATTTNTTLDDTSFKVENGVMSLKLIDLLDKGMAKAGNTTGDIKDLIVRAVSNVGGEPSMIKASISLIDMAKASSVMDTTPTAAQKEEKQAANFITNASTIDPHAYRLDTTITEYKTIFDNMHNADADVKAIAIKTCFTGSDD